METKHILMDEEKNSVAYLLGILKFINSEYDNAQVYDGANIEKITSRMIYNRLRMLMIEGEFSVDFKFMKENPVYVLNNDVIRGISRSDMICAEMLSLWISANNSGLIYVDETKEWYRRKDSGVYTHDESVIYEVYNIVPHAFKILSIMVEVYIDIYEEVVGVDPPPNYNDVKKEMLKIHNRFIGYVNTTQNLSCIAATIKLTSADPRINFSIQELDVREDVVGLENGIIDLKSMTYYTNADEKINEVGIVTHALNVDYNATAKAPRWNKFLNTILRGDKEIISFCARILGSALSGERKTHLPILWGHGANGKTTLIEVVSNILGSYASTTDITMMIQSSYTTKNEYYLASLKGKRMVVMNETRESSKMAEEVVKMLLDSGEIPARMPAGRPFTYQPVFLPVATTNKKIDVSSDYAIARRIFFLGFEYTIPEEDRIPNFASSLKDEYSGILNWLIEGYADYKDKGYAPPQSVVAATKSYLSESDYVSTFIDEELVESDPTDKIRFKQLMYVWNAWAAANYVRSMKRREFKDVMEKHNIMVIKSPVDNQDVVYGYRLKNPLASSNDMAHEESGVDKHDIDKYNNILLQ